LAEETVVLLRCEDDVLCRVRRLVFIDFAVVEDLAGYGILGAFHFSLPKSNDYVARNVRITPIPALLEWIPPHL
jgi:hypothetical protein